MIYAFKKLIRNEIPLNILKFIVKFVEIFFTATHICVNFVVGEQDPREIL